MKRDDDARLQHMWDAAVEAVGYCQGLSQAQFLEDSRTFRAVIQCLEVIGEASRHVSDERKQVIAHLPWDRIRGMRNHLAHAYFDVDLEQVWDAVQNDLPVLINVLASQVDQRP